MRQEGLSNLSVPDLVTEYTSAAAAHGRAMLSFDHRTANRNHDTIASIYQELRRRGPDAQHGLVPLMTHEHNGVQLWAAAHALEFAPHIGEPVLRRLAAVPDVLGLQAEMTLREWHKGTLTFP